VPPFSRPCEGPNNLLCTFIPKKNSPKSSSTTTPCMCFCRFWSIGAGRYFHSTTISLSTAFATMMSDEALKGNSAAKLLVNLAVAIISSRVITRYSTQASIHSIVDFSTLSLRYISRYFSGHSPYWVNGKLSFVPMLRQSVRAHRPFVAVIPSGFCNDAKEQKPSQCCRMTKSSAPLATHVVHHAYLGSQQIFQRSNDFRSPEILETS